MDAKFTREQIAVELARKYREEYAQYFTTEGLAREALDEDDREGFAAISRRAKSKSQFLDGLKAAAAVLGIDEAAFMQAVSSDEEVCHAKNEG